MNIKKIFFIILSNMFIIGCATKTPSDIDNKAKKVIIPNKVNVDFNINESYINNKIRKTIDLVYKNNFIKREIATNEYDLGYNSITYNDYRIYKYQKLKKDDLDVFEINHNLNYNKYSNDKDFENEFLNRVSDVSIKPSIDNYYLNKNSKYLTNFKYSIDFISFNNNIIELKTNKIPSLYIMKINKNSGKLKTLYLNINNNTNLKNYLSYIIKNPLSLYYFILIKKDSIQIYDQNLNLIKDYQLNQFYKKILNIKNNNKNITKIIKLDDLGNYILISKR